MKKYKIDVRKLLGKKQKENKLEFYFIGESEKSHLGFLTILEKI